MGCFSSFLLSALSMIEGAESVNEIIEVFWRGFCAGAFAGFVALGFRYLFSAFKHVALGNVFWRGGEKDD